MEITDALGVLFSEGAAEPGGVRILYYDHDGNFLARAETTAVPKIGDKVCILVDKIRIGLGGLVKAVFRPDAFSQTVGNHKVLEGVVSDLTWVVSTDPEACSVIVWLQPAKCASPA